MKEVDDVITPKVQRLVKMALLYQVNYSNCKVLRPKHMYFTLDLYKCTSLQSSFTQEVLALRSNQRTVPSSPHDRKVEDSLGITITLIERSKGIESIANDWIDNMSLDPIPSMSTFNILLLEKKIPVIVTNSSKDISVKSTSKKSWVIIKYDTHTFIKNMKPVVCKIIYILVHFKHRKTSDWFKYWV